MNSSTQVTNSYSYIALYLNASLLILLTHTHTHPPTASTLTFTQIRKNTKNLDWLWMRRTLTPIKGISDLHWLLLPVPSLTLNHHTSLPYHNTYTHFQYALPTHPSQNSKD